MGKLFGTDGIRGEAGRYPVDETTAYAVGQAVARMFATTDRPAKVLIGRDTRRSGPMLETAFACGVAAMGGTPCLVGVMPTAGVAFLTTSTGCDAGVVISASHNPYQDNGIKVFTGAGFKLSDEQEKEVEDLVLGGDLAQRAALAHGLTGAERIRDAGLRYGEFLKGTFPSGLSLEGTRIVLDMANGATFSVAPKVFAELGAEVIAINDAPDGWNINEECGSQHTEGLRKAVVETKAAAGLAFDGDGDRLIAVDERGTEIAGDQALIACAHALKQEGRLKNDLLVSTVMSNMGLSVACKRLGFENHPAPVGDRQVLQEMQRLGAVLGGEPSGHVIFLEHHTTGDGILTGVQLLAAMLKAGKPLSELAGLMEIFPQKLISVDVSSKPELEAVPRIAAAIAEVETALAGEGRVLVRYSGTQDMCRVMVEGPTMEITERYAAQIADVVKAEIG
jgi:phosphoglucosamine mutase